MPASEASLWQISTVSQACDDRKGCVRVGSTLFQIQCIIESFFNDCLSTSPCSRVSAHSHRAFVNQCEEATSLKNVAASLLCLLKLCLPLQAVGGTGRLDRWVSRSREGSCRGLGLGPASPKLLRPSFKGRSRDAREALAPEPQPKPFGKSDLTVTRWEKKGCDLSSRFVGRRLMYEVRVGLRQSHGKAQTVTSYFGYTILAPCLLPSSGKASQILSTGIHFTAPPRICDYLTSCNTTLQNTRIWYQGLSGPKASRREWQR